MQAHLGPCALSQRASTLTFAGHSRTHLRRTLQVQQARQQRRCRPGVRRAIPKEGPEEAEGAGGPDLESIPDSLPLIGADTDWREFRARLIAGQTASTSGRASEDTQQEHADEADDSTKHWAHPINFPEKGCLLIAHPLMFTTQQQYFAQAVIFIFEHSEQGSAGLILNRPTQYTIGGMPGLETLCPEFAGNYLFLGGDVSPNSMHMLHSHGELSESVAIIRGICMGGFDAAKASVAQQRLPASDFKWFTRYSGWGPGQLQRECASGVWFTAAASSAFILQQGLADNADSGREMWHQVLEMMGGEHAGLSAAQKGLYDPNIMGTTENRDGETS